MRSRPRALGALATSVALFLSSCAHTSRKPASVAAENKYLSPACVQALSQQPYGLQDGQQNWLRSSRASDSPEAIALIVHGLNTLPAKMTDLAHLLNDGGADVINVTLSGHAGNLETFKHVTRAKWLLDLFRGYCLARAEADERRVPLYFMGFSLGGLLGLDLLTGEQQGEVHWDRMVLIAPAAEVRARSHLIKALQIMGEGFIVPSVNHPDYRANPEGTSMAAYLALFKSLDQLHSHSMSAANVPTLLLVDPDDELVSAIGLKKMIRTEKLTQWIYQEVTNGDSQITPAYHHLVIDQASLGDRYWSEVSRMILAHLHQEPLPKLTPLKELCVTAKKWETTQNRDCEQDHWEGCDRRYFECTRILRR